MSTSTALQIPKSWSDAERWAWSEIRAGRIADFNKRYDKVLDPKKPDEWEDTSKDRQLSQAFIATILSEESFCAATTFKGVRIYGAYFKEKINLQHIRVESQLWLENCRFLGPLHFLNLHVNGWFSLEGSWLDDELDLNGAKLESFVSLKGIDVKGPVDLIGAEVGSSLNMIGSIFSSKINMNSIQIHGSLFMRGQAKFNDVELSIGNINGDVEMDGGTFDGKLSMSSMTIGGSLYLRNKGNFKEIDLIRTKVGGDIEMYNSSFDAKLNMDAIEANGNIFMDGQAKFKEVILSNARVGVDIFMNSSSFDEKLKIHSAKIGRSLNMSNKASFKEVDLKWARIGGILNMINSTFNGKLDLNSIEVNQNIFMREEATFEEVDLTAARINGGIDMDSSTFNGKLNMDSVQIGQNLFMRDQAVFAEVGLRSAKINGNLEMSNSTFNDHVVMDGIIVDHYLLARYARFATDREVILHFAKIGSTIDLSGATIGNIDLTSTSIAAEFRIGSGQGHAPPFWKTGARMVLRNTTSGAIQDAGENSWPDYLELEGFTYRRLGGFGAIGQADIANRNKKWFIEWLGRDKSFSPQPYEYLANMLSEAGYPSKAYAVRYAGRKRARQEALAQHTWGLWIGLTLLQYTIGYGLGGRYFRVLWWFGLITLIGFLILLFTTHAAQPDYFKMFWASFDVALPIVGLNDAYEPFILERSSNWVKGYFYIQKLLGYVLGGFLAAGLAGLTQKST